MNGCQNEGGEHVSGLPPENPSKDLLQRERRKRVRRKTETKAMSIIGNQ
jgi:hypothetical protein